VSFTIIDGETGRCINQETITERYDSGKIYSDEFFEKPQVKDIIQSLASDIVDVWITGISPDVRSARCEIESGSELLNAGKAYAENGFWDDAIKVWQNILGENPDNASAYYNLGVAYEALAEYKVAEVHYKKALLLKPNGRYQKALDRLREVWDKRSKKLAEVTNCEQ
jgi:tetratricopeptide (TPR) repeat protein